ncbi:phospho-sugar mutase [Alkalibacillus haloalkaliphilus]|uniref:Phosphoglucomutase n=1 Tax=Alkalibacillus haloalkaliphilus TaxID=94136 RepID=A0A511W1L5_9BACI|nr:phospho-sugar mutase [Alkalibacillus haloalkaliphilus]GEN44238.1 phosphoglucomutase [Alkalibacillus haloalkaliphilus]
MDWKDHYNRWMNFEKLEATLKGQLHNLTETEQEEAFHQPISFGTGGMRGELGPGINRMNVYTIRKATKGLALHIEEKGEEWKEKGVVVAHDPRHMSKQFSLEVAKVMGVHGIKTYLFTDIRPTPLLSFAVRHLKTANGVMITASHNPPEYNGFKVYNEDGGQLPLEPSEQLMEKVNSVENELTIPVLSEEELKEQNLLNWIEGEVDQAYLRKVDSMSYDHSMPKDDLSIVFTPLHGTATSLVEQGLKQQGFSNLTLVKEQVVADPNFTTVASPNPEEHQAFAKAIEYGKQNDAQLLIATDPDADRLGVAVKDDSGEYRVLTGNQLGALLLDYVLRHESFNDGVMIKTIVTSEMGRAIANSYGVETQDVLTGFKFISEKIKQFEETNEKQFVFGYEESYGCLIKPFARDKDAVQATVMTAEMAAYWQKQGYNLYEALQQLYKQHGYFLEDLHSVKLAGLEGQEKINQILEDFKHINEFNVDGLKLEYKEDYSTLQRTNVQTGNEETINLPRTNAIKFKFDQDTWCCLRPSGTEPKIKFYFAVKGETEQQAKDKLNALKQSILDHVKVEV